jgi:hypothetical protein
MGLSIRVRRRYGFAEAAQLGRRVSSGVGGGNGDGGRCGWMSSVVRAECVEGAAEVDSLVEVEVDCERIRMRGICDVTCFRVCGVREVGTVEVR